MTLNKVRSPPKESTPLLSRDECDTTRGGAAAVGIEGGRNSVLLGAKADSDSKTYKLSIAPLGSIALLLFGGLVWLVRPFSPDTGSLADLMPMYGATGSAMSIEPYSAMDPRQMYFSGIKRPDNLPGKAFGDLRKRKLPLPTNSWCENLLYGNHLNRATNKAFQVPYIVDTAGPISGIRYHGATIEANDRMVITTYEPQDGLTLGAVEPLRPDHHVVPFPAFGRLALTLHWESLGNASEYSEGTPRITTPIVRGSPFATMEYTAMTPKIVVQRTLSAAPVVDNNIDPSVPPLVCGKGDGVFSKTPVRVLRELKLQFDSSDMTWIVFVSQPTDFVCSQTPLPPPDPNAPKLPPGVVPTGDQPMARFELRALSPMMPAGVVRVALVNNCTTGQSPIHCNRASGLGPYGYGTKRDSTAYEQLIRDHAEMYPTGNADIEFTFPLGEERADDVVGIQFNWSPVSMSSANSPRRTLGSSPNGAVGENGDIVTSSFTEPAPAQPNLPSHRGLRSTRAEPAWLQAARNRSSANGLLMFALPHHQELLRATHKIYSTGCVWTMHGQACPLIGDSWLLQETTNPVAFEASAPYKSEVLDALRASLLTDLKYEIPINYQRGAGDTYFSGKMLAKLARIIQIGDEVSKMTPADASEQFSAWQAEYQALHARALEHLTAGVEVWLNGSALAPLVYDESWGGMVGCGCDFNGDTNTCRNAFPNCPALLDAGQNYGSGFYNDHHFHYGYHIFSAAVVTKFDPEWGMKYHESVLALVRDIANPSIADPYFPQWRHKDWYLGSSWASGIVTFQGEPYPNGRNQESSSESAAAYEAVALFGLSAANNLGDLDNTLRDRYQRVYHMGKLLLATELRSAKTYYHVQERAANSSSIRIYPDQYRSKVVGMLWSMLAQQQTWFGNEPWKSYGIQLMPLTPSGVNRDDPSWIAEMLPLFKDSCDNDKTCQEQGWSVLVIACQATLGDWRAALSETAALPEYVFDTAGGNGHSRTNTLWWIATRPSDK